MIRATRFSLELWECGAACLVNQQAISLCCSTGPSLPVSLQGLAFIYSLTPHTPTHTFSPTHLENFTPTLSSSSLLRQMNKPTVGRGQGDETWGSWGVCHELPAGLSRTLPPLINSDEGRPS